MTTDQLLDLAPVSLPNYRKRRYLGDDLCLPVAIFIAADQERVRVLYNLLEEIFALVGKDELPPDKTAHVSGFIAKQDVRTLIRTVQAFGVESYQAAPSQLMAKTLHDLRGGGLTLLLNRL